MTHARIGQKALDAISASDTNLNVVFLLHENRVGGNWSSVWQP